MCCKFYPTSKGLCMCKILESIAGQMFSIKIIDNLTNHGKDMHYVIFEGDTDSDVTGVENDSHLIEA